MIQARKNGVIRVTDLHPGATPFRRLREVRRNRAFRSGTREFELQVVRWLRFRSHPRAPVTEHS
ncbi:hypothetical protein BN2475_90007 [Paraburkholderia ribeironis]|uniref:Uncharacterized protein n=1 Tax=Paraburkholderia ribeironis TaxID=1247936 RepID=A0A1N7RMU3_9BURK|nr:hypothetical protein BN2475_90007 [Paraburkholderia ribeironis]